MVTQDLGYIGYFDRESCDLDEFKVLTSRKLTAADAPLASAIVRNVPVYDMADLAPALTGNCLALYCKNPAMTINIVATRKT